MNARKKEYQVRWRKENPEKYKEQQKRSKGYINSDPERLKRLTEYRRKYNSKIRLVVLTYYGMVCACCVEDNIKFLTIDHIENGKGNPAPMKEQGGKGGIGFYQWLVRNDFPEGFQTLCMNCNWAKGVYGECPHLTDKRVLSLE